MDKALSFLKQWHAAHSPRAYFLALSGGQDSMALLALLANFRAQSALQTLPFHAIYCNHQLNPQSALWGEFCVTQAKRFGFTAEVVTLEIPENTGDSWEALARNARYQAFAERLPEGGALLTAHHQNDQIETFFLQLTRGAGLAGLAGMPESKRFGRGYHVRPLLSVSRETIEAFIRAHDLPFIDDPSNADNHYQRNLWRNELLPVLQSAFPHLNRAVARSMAHLQSALTLQQTHLEYDYLAHQSALSAVERERGAILCWQEKDDATQQRLRHAIVRTGITPPPQKRFEAFWSGLSARGHSELRWGEWILVAHRQHLYLYTHHEPAAPPPVAEVNEWQGIGTLFIHHLPTGCEYQHCRWALYPTQALWHAKGARYPLDLKNAFQNAGIAPYLRRRTPLLFCGNELLWVGGLGVSQSALGLAVDWREIARSVRISAYQLPKS